MNYTKTGDLIGTEKVSLKEWWKVLDIINALPEPPPRWLLFGGVGTGKTTLACSIASDYERITLNQSQFADALLGKFLLRDGSTQWADAAASRAARRGVPLVLDEIHKAGGDLDSTLQSVLDDKAICKLNLDNGETVTPEKGYRVIATMNGSPDQLAEAVLDRFDIVLRCDMPHAGILRRLSPEAAAFLTNKIANEPPTGEEWTPKLSPRLFLSFENMRRQGVSNELAAELAFGEGQGKTVLMSMIDASRNEMKVS